MAETTSVVVLSLSVPRWLFLFGFNCHGCTPLRYSSAINPAPGQGDNRGPTRGIQDSLLLVFGGEDFWFVDAQGGGQDVAENGFNGPLFGLCSLSKGVVMAAFDANGHRFSVFGIGFHATKSSTYSTRRN